MSVSGIREAKMWKLYSLIGVENGVATPDGLGTLRQAFSDRCLVSVGRERRRERYGTGGEFKPMRAYPTGDVGPARKGGA